MDLPDTPHRFADLLRDPPILAQGQPLYLDESQRNRLGHFLELSGFRKTQPRAIKWWPPPRGHYAPGNTGFYVPVDTPDPVEVKLPDPAHMTPHEREFMRGQLARFNDHPEEENR